MLSYGTNQPSENIGEPPVRVRLTVSWWEPYSSSRWPLTDFPPSMLREPEYEPDDMDLICRVEKRTTWNVTSGEAVNRPVLSGIEREREGQSQC